MGAVKKLESHWLASCVEILVSKLLKSDNPSSSYNRKCPGYFSRHNVQPVCADVRCVAEVDVGNIAMKLMYELCG